MLVAAAVCPHPPLLVPDLASGAAAELDDVRRQCLDAIDALIVTGAALHVVGVDTGERLPSFGPWGVDLPADVPEPTALPHLVAAWLLGRAGARADRWVLVEGSAPPGACARIGHDLARAADVALLVMGDGSARHSEKAPGYVDPRAADYDAAVASALGAVDTAALLRLDPQLSDELLVAGRPAWQVLAGAVESTPLRCRRSSFDAPYGVGYHVASWVAGA